MKDRSVTPTGRNNLKSPRSKSDHAWTRLSDEELLDLRLCDLNLQIEGTLLEDAIERTYAELEQRGVRFRPHYWLSNEWFTPDGVPGVAIPFYLAHPRLMKLEGRQMLEVEGGTRRWCMQILRHEIGHAIDNAYRLHRKRSWQNIFGKSSQKYPQYYQPKPYSKSFVLHLDYWYAQSHPAEDWAESFAVWLTPGAQWRKRYKGWPALKKLEYVDHIMREIAGQRPSITTREQFEPLKSLKTTLRKHYEAKRRRYGKESPAFYDRDLRRLFSDSHEDAQGPLAHLFLQRIRPEIRRLVARWTSEYQYSIDRVLEGMIERCRQLKLRVNRPVHEATLEASIMLTIQTMNFLHSGRHRLVL